MIVLMTKSRRSKLAGWVRVALLLIIGGGSVLAYVALGMTVNGQPSSQPFPGAVAVLQPSGQASGDVVQLEVDSQITDQRQLQYVVQVCGPVPYSGELVMAGAARLSHAQARLTDWQGVTTRPFTRGVYVVAMTDTAHDNGLLANMRDPQLVSFSFAKPPSCPLGPLTNPMLFNGLVVSGRPGAPVNQSWTSPFGWWHGPQVGQAWPLSGTLSWSAVGDGPILWEISAASVPAIGEWVTPPVQNVLIVPELGSTQPWSGLADGIPLNWTIDATEPAADQPGSALAPANPGIFQPLGWSSSTPIAPTARFTDRASLATWQNFVVVAAVGMAIGGSMLASVAFEKLKPDIGVPKPDTPTSVQARA
jgi:hypothetical protein